MITFLKFFFYLTDVDEYSGPHEFVLKSHLRKKIKHQMSLKRISDLDILSTYGKENIKTIYGKSGNGFAGDT